MQRPPESGDANQRTGAFWDEQHRDGDAAAAHDNFLAHPLVQAYVSMRAFDGSIAGHLDVAIAELRRRTSPGDRILSIGCGTALKEEVVARNLPDRRFVATDIAERTLAEARERLAGNGVVNLELRIGDFNRLELDRDDWAAVLCIGALHHVEALEAFWDACREGLRPGGVVLAHEYVGADRLQWTESQCLEGTRALEELVPAELRPHHTEVRPSGVAHMLSVDPSEAVRSSQILPTARGAGWTLEGYAGAGCSLLQPVLMHQIDRFDPSDWSANRVLAQLFEREDHLMREGVLGDDFAVFVARPPA